MSKAAVCLLTKLLNPGKFGGYLSCKMKLSDSAFEQAIDDFGPRQDIDEIKIDGVKPDLEGGFPQTENVCSQLVLGFNTMYGEHGVQAANCEATDLELRKANLAIAVGLYNSFVNRVLLKIEELGRITPSNYPAVFGGVVGEQAKLDWYKTQLRLGLRNLVDQKFVDEFEDFMKGERAEDSIIGYSADPRPQTIDLQKSDDIAVLETLAWERFKLLLEGINNDLATGMVEAIKGRFPYYSTSSADLHESVSLAISDFMASKGSWYKPVIGLVYRDNRFRIEYAKQ